MVTSVTYFLYNRQTVANRYFRSPRHCHNTFFMHVIVFVLRRPVLTNGDPAGGPQPRTNIMALLGALAAAVGGRPGCVLRVAADAITFYCGGVGDTDGVGGGPDAGADDDGDAGPVNYYPSAAAAADRGRIVDYIRPVRSVAADEYAAGASSTDGYYNVDADNGSVAVTLANVTTGVELFLNASFNRTDDAENVENLTNYIFVITIGIILGAMILTTICGECVFSSRVITDCMATR